MSPAYPIHSIGGTESIETSEVDTFWHNLPLTRVLRLGLLESHLSVISKND